MHFGDLQFSTGKKEILQNIRHLQFEVNLHFLFLEEFQCLPRTLKNNEIYVPLRLWYFVENYHLLCGGDHNFWKLKYWESLHHAPYHNEVNQIGRPNFKPVNHVFRDRNES